MTNEYDVIVIGAGTGGYVAAIRAAQLGLKVGLCRESRRRSAARACIWGCIPTKALLEHAHALKVVQGAKEWGVTIGDGTAARSIDMKQVHARKDKIVTGLTKGVEFLFKKNKIDWIKGTRAWPATAVVDVFEGDKQTLEATRRSSSPPDPRRAACRHHDRSRAHHHERRGDSPEGVPKSIAIHGQRRRRRRVRLDLPAASAAR
jgi:pyruvate/2-oxoglutarate dehydrogenase complex dihydrolipoamide dehydrogenase (E3) component